MINGLVQHMAVEESTGIQWAKSLGSVSLFYDTVDRSILFYSIP